ncbi:hypothetical protein Tco_1518028 [Tanacetum coccineum]
MKTHEGMISKDASKIDNNVAGASYDKDNITEAFKQDEDKYVNNIIQLEDKNKDLENIVCKMGKSSQTLRMLTNEQSLYRENKQKMGLGYTDPCPLGQAIACHPKLYDAEVLGLHYVLYDTFVPQTELSPEQEYFSIPPTSNNSSESKDVPSESPVLKMPKESRLLKMFDTMGDAITGLHRINNTLLQDAERRWLSDSQNELRKFYKTDVIPMSRYLYKNLKEIKEELIEEVQEMLNIFESMESKNLKEIKEELIEEVQEMLNIFESMERKVNRTSKKNENFQYKIDQLLDANIANDVKIIVMQSYVEIKNNEEIERFSNESKEGDMFCNVVVEVKEKLSKQIVQLEKDFAKLEAQSIAFEIALQHKTQENKSLKTLQKENENFMVSLQIENAHLKQNYKDLFKSVQSSRVENIQCDEVKIKFNVDKIETQNIELEHQVASLIKDNEHLKLTYQNLFDSIKKSRIVELKKTLEKQTKENSDLLMKIENLKNAFADEVKGATMRKLNVLDKENCDFGSKVTHLEKIIAQKTKDFNDVKLELSNRTAKFEAYFEKLKNTKVVLERHLARKVDDSKAEKD